MCTEPDYEFPESFIKTLRRLDSKDCGALSIKLEPDTGALILKIGEQTGFSANTIAAALLCEGIAGFREKGILF